MTLYVYINVTNVAIKLAYLILTHIAYIYKCNQCGNQVSILDTHTYSILGISLPWRLETAGGRCSPHRQVLCLATRSWRCPPWTWSPSLPWKMSSRPSSCLWSGLAQDGLHGPYQSPPALRKLLWYSLLFGNNWEDCWLATIQFCFITFTSQFHEHLCPGTNLGGRCVC